ncbi:MAG TPA: MBL fold metallo-hydrolase [Candidatus Aphodovivens avistercoris]|nr:MBL fold metallo-hydrolase [Candidatus Aphodovivens avistercoris]
MLSTLINSNPEIHAIRVPYTLPHVTPTNSYVIIDREDALVIDNATFVEKGRPYFEEALWELGIDPSSARFFLTHAHRDHAGLTDAIAGTHATAYLSPAERDHHFAPHSAAFSEWIARRLIEEGVPADEAKDSQRVVSCREYTGRFRGTAVPLDDGETIRVGSLSLRAVATPGHTIGQLALLHPKSGILFSGDAVLFGIAPSVGFYPDDRDAIADTLTTLEMISASSATELYLGHGDPTAQFRMRCTQLARHYRMRSLEFERVIEENPGITGIEAMKRIRWSRHENRTWEDTTLPQRSHCIYGEGMSYLNHLVLEGKIERGRNANGTACYRPVRN